MQLIKPNTLCWTTVDAACLPEVEVWTMEEMLRDSKHVHRTIRAVVQMKMMNYH